MAIRRIAVPKIASQAGNPKLYEALKDIVNGASVRSNELEEALLNLTASDVANVPYGTISADNVQGALYGLDDSTQKLHGVPLNTYGQYDFTVSYDETTRIVTLTPTGLAINVWILGKLYTYPGVRTFTAHNNLTSGYFFYVDEFGQFQWSTSFWDLTKHAPIAYVYYNATTAKGVMFEERHTAKRDPVWHSHAHNVIGTQTLSGFAASGYTLNTDSDAAVTFAIAYGYIADEDLVSYIAAVPDGTYTVWERSGALGEWKWTASNAFPFFKGTTYPTYNAVVAGSWSRVELASTEYTNYYVFAVPTPTAALSVAIIPGQNKFTSLTAAQAESVSSIDWGSMPFQEIAPLYRFTLRAFVSYVGTNKCQIQDFSRLAGSRTSISLSGSLGAHNSLTGRTALDTHPASSITFTPYSTITATEVQTAIQQVLDASVPSGVISAYAGTTAPTGYLLCDGSEVSQVTYAALYAVCGTAYNTGGEAVGNFRLPDLRQRFPFGKAAAGTGSTLGGTGGTIDHVHTVDPPDTSSGNNAGVGVQVCQDNVVATAAGTHTHTTDIASFNSGTANPPFLALNFIIKT